MEIKSSIETEDCILGICHPFGASIKCKHMNNLIGAVDPHNETIPVSIPNIDKEHFVLERDNLKLHVIDGCKGHINLGSEYMSTFISDRPDEHLRSVLRHKVHIGV